MKIFQSIGFAIMLISTSICADNITSLGHQAHANAPILSHSFSHVNGITAVNLAAGNNNVQSSNFIHAPDKAEIFLSSETSYQEVKDDAVVAVGNNVFHQAKGYVSAQMTSGNGNQQHNVIVFQPNPIELDDFDDLIVVDLTTQRASQEDQDSSSKFHLNVELAPEALTGAGGVIQVSQVAGSGNVARNTFQMPTTIN